MVDYTVHKKYFVPDLYAIACHTVNGESVFSDGVRHHLLKGVIESFEAKKRLKYLAHLCLPDQIYLLISLGSKQNIDEIVQRIKTKYSQEFAALLGNPGKMMLFEQSHRIHGPLDLDAFIAQLDALHYMPVELGLVMRPEEWPYSSYELWVERQLYKLGWGWEKPR